jgi:hypothetical protein
VIYAWADKGELRFGEALAMSIHDALFRSPHVPEFGEGGPYFVVALAIAAAGVATALYRPVALNNIVAYPLSRSQRAQVHFRGGLVDGAVFLFIAGPGLFAIGLLTGWVVGYEPRFDFMPFFLRVLMLTVILMPLAHVGRLRLHAATRRRAENTMLGVIFGVVGFVVAVFLLTLAWPAIFVSPIVELITLLVALLISQLLYRHKLTTYYQTADLA